MIDGTTRPDHLLKTSQNFAIAVIRFARMRSTAVQFMNLYPSRKFRHEKPDLKVLLERKESDYVDVSSVSWPRQGKVSNSGPLASDLKNSIQYTVTYDSLITVQYNSITV